MSESKRGWMPQLKQRANAPFYSLLFWSALNRGLDDGHPHWRDLTQSANQMLKSSRNTFTDTSDTMFYHLSRHHLIQSTSHKKLTITRLKGQQRLSEAIGALIFLCRWIEGRVDWRMKKLKKRHYKELFGKKKGD